MLFILLILKLDKFKEVKEQKLLNIYIFFTLFILKLDICNDLIQ